MDQAKESRNLSPESAFAVELARSARKSAYAVEASARFLPLLLLLLLFLPPVAVADLEARVEIRSPFCVTFTRVDNRSGWSSSNVERMIV